MKGAKHMALQFNTIGFINFNKDYNKVLKSGAITVSFTSTQKIKTVNTKNNISMVLSLLN